MADGYRGAIGAFPYAFHKSDSWFFRVYLVVGLLAALVIGVVVTLALVVEMGRTEDLMQGGVTAFSRSLFVLLGFLAVGPLVAPILLVARRHRRGADVHRLYDQALASCGYLFLASLYVALLVTAPAEHREPTTSTLIEFLYAVPPAFGLVPPVVAGIAIAVAHRRLRA